MTVIAKGFTHDGVYYRLYWCYTDGKARVDFTDKKDNNEIWVVSDKPIMNEQKAVTEGKIVARYLEQNGSWIIRGKGKNKPLFPSRLVFSSAITPGTYNILPQLRGAKRGIQAEMEQAQEESEQIEQPMQEANKPPKVRDAKPMQFALPKVRQFGLGAEGRHRVKVKFKSILDELGIRITPSMHVRVEELAYMLDRRHFNTPRDEAVDKVLVDLTRWIQENIYFKK